MACPSPPTSQQCCAPLGYFDRVGHVFAPTGCAFGIGWDGFVSRSTHHLQLLAVPVVYFLLGPRPSAGTPREHWKCAHVEDSDLFAGSSLQAQKPTSQMEGRSCSMEFKPPGVASTSHVSSAHATWVMVSSPMLMPRLEPRHASCRGSKMCCRIQRKIMGAAVQP